MTNHTMPLLTDEYRQRLIEVATKRLGQYQTMKQSQECAGLKPRGGIAFDYQLSIDLMEIAIASLTAKPDHYKVDVYKGESLIASCLPSEPEGSPAEYPYSFVQTPYFTAQPVPVLKLPDEKDHYPITSESEAWKISHNLEAAGFNECLAEVKRLNGVTE